MTGPRVLTVGAVARVLGVNAGTVSRYLDAGLLEGHTLPSGHRRVTAESLERILDSRTKLSSTVTIIGAK